MKDNSGRSVTFFLTEKVLPFVLVLWAVFWHHGILSNFWLFDDPALLKFAISYSPLQYFSPEVYEKLSRANFTPSLGFSFRLDWLIFGLDPHWFYMHHLISICILSIVFFALLKLWLSPSLSFVGAALFIISPPFVEAAQMLMVRHYIEGLIFALLSCYFFVIGLRRRNNTAGAIGALFYLIASLAKEVYVPLPFLLLLLPESSWQMRMKRLVPWGIGIAIYVILRIYVLGRLVGGYGLTLSNEDFILFLPRLIDAMGGGFHAPGETVLSRYWWPFFILASTFLAIICLWIRERRTLFLIFLAVPFVVLPVIPVSSLMSSRYAYVITFCWIIGHCMCWKALLKTGKGKAVMAVMLWSTVMLLAFLIMNSKNTALYEHILRQEAEGRFIMNQGGAKDILADPVTSEWYYSGLLWMRKEIKGVPESPTIGYDSYIFCEEFSTGGGKNLGVNENFHVWRFDPEKRTLISKDIVDFCSNEISLAARPAAPLFLKIHYEENTVSWVTGPYSTGHYAILFAPPKTRYVHEIGPQGSWYLPMENGRIIPIRLRYISTEGWRTYSPVLYFKKEGEYTNLFWQR